MQPAAKQFVMVEAKMFMSLCRPPSSLTAEIPQLNFGRPLEKKSAHSDQAEHPSHSSA
jgi:hypothetical protein